MVFNHVNKGYQLVFYGDPALIMLLAILIPGMMVEPAPTKLPSPMVTFPHTVVRGQVYVPTRTVSWSTAVRVLIIQFSPMTLPV